MPYTTEWVIDNGIIKTRIAANLTPDRREAKDRLLNQLLQESEKQNTHIILDCSDLNFPTFHNWRWIRNTGLGWLVMFGVDNPITKFAMSLGLQALGVRSHFVDDYESAVKFLQEVDITLPKEIHIA